MIAEKFAELNAEITELSGGQTRVMLAVKHQSSDAIREAINAGGTLLGHNIIQQLTAVEEDLRERCLDHESHVIGHVQSNKARQAVENATCIQTLDKVKTATRLDTVAESLGVVRDVYIQVNSAGSDSQFGMDPAEVLGFADMISSELPYLNLAGLMTIGAHTDNETAIAQSFRITRGLRDKLQHCGHTSCTELSMGMSSDYRIAIAEGSTMIRVGRQVFGERQTK